MSTVAPLARSDGAKLSYTRSTNASSCPDEASLREAVAQRVGRDPFDGEDAFVDVQVERVADELVGTVEVREGGVVAARPRADDAGAIGHGRRRAVEHRQEPIGEHRQEGRLCLHDVRLRIRRTHHVAGDDDDRDDRAIHADLDVGRCEGAEDLEDGVRPGRAAGHSIDPAGVGLMVAPTVLPTA